MKVSIYTLGCKVNLYESEVIINEFKKKGYEIVPFESKSDICIINTCTVTNTSDKKSRNIIRQAVKNNPNAVIVVMGCYSQIRSEDIKNIDGVDIIIGNTNKSRVVLLVEEYLKNKKSINKIEDIMHTTFEPMELDSFETRTRAFVKVQDGCNNFCSYCIIPYTRGNIRSKEKEDVVNEIKCLVKNNYKEVFTVIGENTLVTQAETKNLIGTIQLSSDFQLNIDFSLGDSVTYLNNQWGIQENVMIRELRLQYSTNGFIAQASLGYLLPTLEDKLGVTLS